MSLCKRRVSGRTIPVAVKHLIPGSRPEPASISVAGFAAVLVFCLLICSALPLHAAYALSCSSQPAPLEMQLKRSSFVFTGIAERDGGGFVPFRLTHVFKPPEGGLPKGAQVQVSFGFIGGFDRGKEYLIFGFNTKVNGPVITTITSSCGTRVTADTLVADLRVKKKNPTLFSTPDAALIFIGRVKNTRQWRSTWNTPPESLAIVDFDIAELIRNAPRRELPYQKVKESQRLRVFTCGNAYHLGHRYVVFAESGAPRHLPGAPKFDDVHYTSQCTAGGSVDLNEKAILDRLSKTHTPYLANPPEL